MKTEPVYQTIGALIRSRRRRLDWPQSKLAAELGISRATLANIETGRQRILVHQLYALAEALDLKPADLLPARDGRARADSTALPIPGDLNPAQREQIARLLGSATPTAAKPKETSDGTPPPKATRTARRETT